MQRVSRTRQECGLVGTGNVATSRSLVFETGSEEGIKERAVGQYDCCGTSPGISRS